MPQPSRLRAPNSAAWRRDVGRRHARGEQTLHGLGDHQTQVVGEPVVEPAAPVGGRVGVAGLVPDPDLAVMQLDREGRHIVGPQIEGAAAREIEPRVVPMAGEDAVGNRAPVQREPEMRAAIVHGEHAALVVDDENRAAPAGHHPPPLRLQLRDRPGADEIVSSLTHQPAPCARPGPSERWKATAAAPSRAARSSPGRAAGVPQARGSPGARA
jgi:hypothetical protein